ncbi:MAG: hypothetical protein KBS46_06460 [Clostridiales bacterium]|nr:hypothetical protein [Candidatus Apopatocola equi]MCQ2440097.1 hypothetical protein [Oscillospiraceae bacterium]
MKGTEKIIAHIQADAQAQVDAILAKCEEQCAALRSEYEAKANAAYEERLRVGKEECAAQTESTNRLAQMEARKGVLALKQEMISESFEKACGKIVALPEEQYVALLAKLAKEAAVTGSERIVLNKRDKAAIGAAVCEKANALLGNGQLTVAEETGDFAGGLILRRDSIEVNCTAELLVKLCREELSSKVAGVLFA